MNELENSGRRMPYELPEEQFDALRERILNRTTHREKSPGASFARSGWIAAAFAVVIVAVAVSVYFAGQKPEQNLDQLLRTAPDETLQHAAAENYDDILFNQQL